MLVYALTPPPPSLPPKYPRTLTAGQKAEAAAGKKAVEDAKKAAEEDKQWSKGSKSNAKK